MITQKRDSILWRKQYSFVVELEPLPKSDELPLTETQVSCFVVQQSFEKYTNFSISSMEIEVL